MLLAILYCESDRIGGAAMAVDQMPHGDQFWTDIFPGKFEAGSLQETRYVTVNQHELSYKLMSLGVDTRFCGRELAVELESHIAPTLSSCDVT